MKIIIAAGGKGERLQSITNILPKPLVEIQGKPILEHIIIFLKKQGFTKFVLLLCYLHNLITNYFGDGSNFGVRIDYIFENPQKPLGTAGSISQARKFITDTFAVTYADILRDLDVKDMIDFHKKNHSVATLNVYKRVGRNPKSMISFNEHYRINYYKERPEKKEIKDNFVWANGSFYIFEPQIFNFVPHNIYADFGRDIFPKILSQGKEMYAYPSNGRFIDIGTVEKLEKAKKMFST